MNPWAGLVLGVSLASGVAFAVGVPVLRLRGHYLAMATLAFGTIVSAVVVGTQRLGAADGISGVPPFPILPGVRIGGGSADRVVNYYLAWGLVALAMLLLGNLVRSRTGRALRAIHGAEDAARAMGVDAARLKVRVFVLAAAMAAAAGVLLTHYVGGIGPSEASVMKSVRYVAMVAVGGMGSLWGALSAAAVLEFLSLRGVFGAHDDAVFGGILLLVMLFAPDGILELQGPRDPGAAARPAGRIRGGRVNLLEVSGISKRFGGVQAVKGVSFRVRKGAVKAVIGPNGAGKTTLFDLLSGFRAPDEGTVRFQDREIQGSAPHEVAALGISRTFQNLKLFGHMTALENVMVGRHVRSRAGMLAGMFSPPAARREEREIEERARAEMRFLGVEPLARSPAGSLAYGQQRAVELARALCAEPDAPAPRRAGGGPQHAGDRRAGRPGAAHPRAGRHRAPRRARHVARHAHLRRGGRALLRPEDRRRRPALGAAQPGGRPGLPG